MKQPSITMNWDDLEKLIEYGKNEPEEAIKRIYNHFSVPLDKFKTKFQTIYLDDREYNLAVHALEGRGDRIMCLNLLLSFIKSRRAVLDQGLSFQFTLQNFKVNTVLEYKINIYVKFRNVGIFPLNPMAAEDRESGEYPNVDPGDHYSGPVFFPNLAVWMHAGFIQLQGV